MPFDTENLPVFSMTRAAVLLPHVPSQLIRLSLIDLEQVERLPGYHVNMWAFHQPDGALCIVCAAGATMAVRLGLSRGLSITPDDFDAHNREALSFISDCAVAPWVQSAIRHVDRIGGWPIEIDIPYPAYKADRAGFYASRRALADAFEQSGQ